MKDSNFILRSLKTLAGKTTIIYEMHQPNGDIDRCSYTSDKVPPASLFDELNKLRPFLAEVHYMDSSSKVQVYGVKLSKYLEKMTIVINGLMTTPATRIVKIDSEEIPFFGELYKWIPELKSIANNINKIAYGIVLDEQSSQTHIEFPENQ